MGTWVRKLLALLESIDAADLSQVATTAAWMGTEGQDAEQATGAALVLCAADGPPPGRAVQAAGAPAVTGSAVKAGTNKAASSVNVAGKRTASAAAGLASAVNRGRKSK